MVAEIFECLVIEPPLELLKSRQIPSKTLYITHFEGWIRCNSKLASVAQSGFVGSVFVFQGNVLTCETVFC